MEKEKINMELCSGCLKADNIDECSIYSMPSVWVKKGGCPMKTNKKVEIKKDKKINPLKASKRSNR